MTSILPAILPEDFVDLEEKMEMVAGHVAMVHIDVEDKTLTGRATWPYAGDPSEFLKISDEVEGFPFWEDVSFEAHLMVKEPLEIVEDWVRAGAERVIVHIEAFENDAAVTEALNALRTRYGQANSFVGVEIGLAVDMTTPIKAVLTHVLEADFIQLMAIDRIGSQGEDFDEKIFDKIKELKLHNPDTIISVDGGVTLEHAERLAEAGAERIAVGSAIFGSGDPEGTLLDMIDQVES